MSWALTELAKRLKPRRRLSVSEWADGHRRLSPKSSSEPGVWRTSRVPYLREIMDALSLDSPGQRVVVKKSAQGGGTEVACNWIGYIMDHVHLAKPTLIVLPTEKLATRWVLQRLRPMVESTPPLRALIDVSKSRDGSNRLDAIDYPGGILYISNAGSASNLKSDSIAFVICDEVDEFDWSVDGRGDPMGMIESRQANFPRRKLLIVSTPTVKGSSRIDGEWDASDQRRYEVPCPHCGERQPLVWEHLCWSQDLTQVWYTCAVNGCVIEERDKHGMLAAGAWVAQRESAIRGYHWNALYNPIGLGYAWRELVAQWLRAQESEEMLQQFVNERLGLAWEDRRTATRADDLSQRVEPYRFGTLPEGALLVTAGVDTQDDRLEVQVVAWGEGGAFWVVDYAILTGDPGRPDVWVALTDLLGRPLTSAAGVLASIEACAIDMGGHHTDTVKAYVRAAGSRRLLAVQGSAHRVNRVLSPPRATDFTSAGRTIRRGMRYHQVGTELAKDTLYRILRTDADHAPVDRLGHFSADLQPEYFEGLLAEVWNPRRNRYEKRRGIRRNEPLDTWVYAYAAAHHPDRAICLDRQTPRDWAHRRARLHPEVAPEAPPSAPVTVGVTLPPKASAPIPRRPTQPPSRIIR
jgi:phage terminase large subunit GpA-like protein